MPDDKIEIDKFTSKLQDNSINDKEIINIFFDKKSVIVQI